MGVIPNGIFLEFDCDTLEEPITLTATQPQATVATVTLNINQNNLVWLTAYVDWESIPASNRGLIIRIVRDDDITFCAATDNSGPQATTATALTCCDKNPSAGPRTYRLVAEATNLSGEQTIILNQSTLTGAQIEN